ncbi:MAG: metallopeptidase family protein [Planctomycetaceae bacterium]|nr:metallopeptidase family protein [Planctomycetaceae bacterium]
MDRDLREYFDQQMDAVIQALPEQVHRLLDDVTMYVEDHPSQEVMQRMRIRRRHQLCGLYTGIPLGSRSVEHSGVLSDAVHIYREGILSLAMDRHGRIDQEELRHQIRLTVLHELGHHHGMDEQDLHELGY